MGTIAEEISALRERIDLAYDHVQTKGGQIPEETNSWNLPDAIDTIPTGDGANFYGISSLTQMLPLSMDIETGRWDTVPSDQSPPAAISFPCKKIIGPYINSNDLNLDSNKPRGFRSMFGAYYESTTGSGYPNGNSPTMRAINGWLPNVSSVSFPELTHISGYSVLEGMCELNPNIKRVDFPKLENVQGPRSISHAFAYTVLDKESLENFPKHIRLIDSGYAMWQSFYVAGGSNADVSYDHLSSGMTQAYIFNQAYAWTGISALRFPALSVIGLENGQSQGYQFRQATANCSNLREISFGALLSTYTDSTFYQMVIMSNNATRNLSSVEFPKLEYIRGNEVFREAFYYCQNLSSLEFPELVEISATGGNPMFYGMLSYCHNFKELRFPKLATMTQVQNTAYFPLNRINPYNNPTQRWKLYCPSLTKLTFGTTSSANYGFGGNYGMTDIYLDSVSAITNNYGFVTCPQLSAIHFGAENEEAIKATTGFGTAWGRGAGNVQILFDR